MRVAFAHEAFAGVCVYSTRSSAYQTVNAFSFAAAEKEEYFDQYVL